MKIYQEDNVFEATMKRIKFAFENFDNIYVSSGKRFNRK